MEWLQHGDLHAYLCRQDREPLQIPESQAQQVVSQLLDGLKFMHENGFAHRDFKPSVSFLFIADFLASHAQ
jgi:calcium/calmodulin-dependent protein kinase I